MSFKNRKLGVIPSPPDYRDYRINEFIDAAKDFPDYYLVPPFKNEKDIPIHDQKSTSMCVAFTGISITEQQEYDETGKYIKMSPCWIYGNRTNDMYAGEGMIPREAWAQLCKDGVPHYNEMPYMGSFTNCYLEVVKNKDRLKKQALNQKKKSYAAVTLKNANEIRTAIMECGAINVSMAIYKDFYDVKKDGFIEKATGSIYGYHSVTCMGFFEKNSKLYLIIANSWGKNWGKAGLCYIPYNYKAIQEIWAITDLQRKVIEADISAMLIPPGHFMLPFRSLFEAQGAEEIAWGRLDNGKVWGSAILPAGKKRKVYIEENSKDIVIEILE